MDLLRSLELTGSKPFFAMTKSTDDMILGIFLTNSEIDLKWIHKDTDGTRGIRTLTDFEKQLYAITLEQTPEGIPKLIFGHQFFEQDDYYLINDPVYEGSLCVFYQSKTMGPSIAREVFIDLECNKAYCKAETEHNEQFVETKDIDLGSMAYLLKK